MGILKFYFRPKVQRRENVGGSLKTLGLLRTLGVRSSGLTPLTNRNIIHKNTFVK